jgi:hypothetical protein
LERIGGVDADDGLDFVFDAIRVGGRQINLVEYRDDLQSLLHRRVAVGDRLRLNTLRRVNNQQCTFAGR